MTKQIRSVELDNEELFYFMLWLNERDLRISDLTDSQIETWLKEFRRG